jgi:energy-coupling factor transporter ATP-binding protein EcfA2
MEKNPEKNGRQKKNMAMQTATTIKLEPCRDTDPTSDGDTMVTRRLMMPNDTCARDMVIKYAKHLSRNTDAAAVWCVHDDDLAINILTGETFDDTKVDMDDLVCMDKGSDALQQSMTFKYMDAQCVFRNVFMPTMSLTNFHVFDKYIVFERSARSVQAMKWQTFLARFFFDAAAAAHANGKINQLVYYTNKGRMWNLLSRSDVRPPSSVFLPMPLMTEITQELASFKNGEVLAKTHHIIYKRCYLLEGPPGGGKSSLINMIATILGRSIHILNPRNSSLEGDTSISTLVSDIRHKCVLVMEDIDTFFDFHKSRDEAKFSFSEFLNILSGVFVPHALVIVVTTNHPEKIKATVTRSGRVDKVFHVPAYTKEGISAMMRSYLRAIPDGAIEDLAQTALAIMSTKGKRLSMASLQTVLFDIELAGISDPVQIKKTMREKFAAERSGDEFDAYENMVI